MLEVFGFFCVVTLIFHARMNKVPTPEALSPTNPWHKHLYTLYAASILIMVRSVFRAVEYIQGNDGYLLRNEVFLYIFDGVLMLAVMVVFNVIHPSVVKAYLKGGNVSKGWKLYKLRGGKSGSSSTSNA